MANAIRILKEKYLILKEIAKGGFGVVYQGWDNDLDMPVAIKEVISDKLSSKAHLEMFLDEARITSRLNHSNIVHIHEFIRTQNEEFYIVMEYIDGHDLKTIQKALKKNNIKFPIEYALYVISVVCDALYYSHNLKDYLTKKDLNIVHRDISPSNVIIQTDGQVKIIDFGIAKSRHRVQEETMDGRIRGKIKYMAPEQLLGGINSDHRIDQFSTAVVLFELLTGESLHDTSKSIIEIAKNLEEERIDIKPFLEKNNIPAELGLVIQKAMQKDPDKRFHDMLDFKAPLLKFIDPFKSYRHEIQAWFDTLELPSQKIITPGDISSSQELEKIIINDSNTNSSSSHSITSGEKSHVSISSNDSASNISESDELEEKLGFVKTLELALEDLKAVYDKKFKYISFIILILFLTFISFDIFIFRTFNFSKKIYYTLLPPPITVISSPSNARVFVDGKDAGVTPQYIDDINVGIHTIIIEKQGFVPYEYTFTITDDSDNLEIPFNLNRELVINTIPPEGDIFVNTKKISNNKVELGWNDEASIHVEKASFIPSSRISYIGIEERIFRGLTSAWKVDTTNANVGEYILTCMLNKPVLITSNPTNSNIYLNSDTIPIGNSGDNPLFEFATGRHQIFVTHNDGWKIENAKEIIINENNTEDTISIHFDLFKFLKIDVKDVYNNQPITANISYRRNTNDSISIIPMNTEDVLKLMNRRYNFTLTKNKYKNKEIPLYPNKTKNKITVKLTPEDPLITLKVNRWVGKELKPIENANIRIDTFINELTGINGNFKQRISPDTYKISILAEGFKDINENIIIHKRVDKEYSYTLYENDSQQKIVLYKYDKEKKKVLFDEKWKILVKTEQDSLITKRAFKKKNNTIDLYLEPGEFKFIVSAKNFHKKTIDVTLDPGIERGEIEIIIREISTLDKFKKKVGL